MYATVAALWAAAWAFAPATRAADRPARNIFWPVGSYSGETPMITTTALVTRTSSDHVPTTPPPSIPSSSADWDGAQDSIRVDGVSSSSTGSAVALVNHKVYEVGSILEVNYRGKQYPFKIMKIDEKGLELRRMDDAGSGKAETTKALPAPAKKKEEGRRHDNQ